MQTPYGCYPHTDSQSHLLTVYIPSDRKSIFDDESTSTHQIVKDHVLEAKVVGKNIPPGTQTVSSAFGLFINQLLYQTSTLYFSMNKSLQQKLPLFFCLLFLPLCMLAQSEKGSISGYIQSENKEPLPNMTIGLDETAYGTTSSETGHFLLKNIPAGKYILSISGIGYQALKQTIVVNAGQRISLNYQLNSKTNELSEIVITSDRKSGFTAITKQAIPLRDIPLTTSSVSVKTIEQRGADDLGEAMKNTTGVRANNTYGGFQHFTIRGFSNFVLLVDGVRDERHNISTSAPTTNLANVESIEVLKGPASVLFGHSALGGIINIVRKRPTKEFKAEFSATYGSYNTRRMRAGASGSISNQLRYRVDFGMSDTEGYRYSGSTTNNAYLALEYTPTSKDLFYLTVGVNKDNYDTDTGIPMLEGSKKIPGLDVDTRYNDPADFLKHTRFDYQLKFVHQFSEKVKLSDQVSYYDDNINYFSTEELSVNASLDSLTRSFPFYFNHLTKPLQNQLELSSEWLTGSIVHKVLVGYALSILDRKTYNGDVNGPAKNATIPIHNPILNQGYISFTDQNYRATMENVHGVYIQDWIKVAEYLKALIGLRYDIFNGSYYTNQVDATRHVTEKGPKSTISKNALTYRFGLVYQPFEPLSVYSSYSTYFKPSRRIAPNGETFDPETGYQAEIGSRLERSGWTAILAFYYMRKNNQVEALAGGIYKRIGSAESKGFEAEISGSLYRGLDVTAGYTFSKAKYLPYEGSEINPVAGKRVSFAPVNMLNLWLNYEWQYTALKGLNLGAGVNYMSDTFTNSTNTYTLPAYTVTDVAIGYRLGRINIRLNLNNVLNKRYFANAIYSNQFSPGPTRNFLLSLKYTI
ncbi:TonB-dependent receptor [Xanthocytophaga flava]|uniref:TonB-dependent receptor n=1 Tax=Xanthocytophaga flava TaxID=3048013 RepID=UPI0028D04B6A|nr:TonB-dependent receptor [Xanthocytophaga flavus]MDJ1470802.1 TonB-dependent receptor [Xanthocytophaga flavus]